MGSCHHATIPLSLSPNIITESLFGAGADVKKKNSSCLTHTHHFSTHVPPYNIMIYEAIHNLHLRPTLNGVPRSKFLGT